MKISGLYSYDISNNTEYLKTEDSSEGIGSVAAGEIIEGIVISADTSTTVSFEKLNNRIISFDSSAIHDAEVGQKRSFRVMEANEERLVLKDMGETGSNLAARGVLSAKINPNMPQMVDDFSETMDEEEEDKSSIGRMSEEDYSDLTDELFSIEDYKAERLVRALKRIKSNRAAREQSISEQSRQIREDRKSIRRQAVRAAAEKYSVSLELVESLVRADLPLTKENIMDVNSAVVMSAEAALMTDNAYAYLIGEELEPTVANIYKAVYSGTVKRTYLNDDDWKKLAPAAMEIVNEAADENSTEPEKTVITLSDAKWMLEYDIPLNKENLIYKKELELLKNRQPLEKEVADAAAAALNRGGKAADAILIASHEPTNQSALEGSAGQLTSRLRLQEIRLTMALNSSSVSGTEKENAAFLESLDVIRSEVEQLKNQLRSIYAELAKETETAITDRSLEIAIETGLAIEDITEAGPALYGKLNSVFGSMSAASVISLETMGNTARQIAVEMNTVGPNVISSYENSSTEIRTDLGDSIEKAFMGVDPLLEDLEMELTDANRKAVRILGHNSMDITAESIERIKFYDSKVTAMVERLRPPVVMSMIKRGYNPLEKDIDSINREIDEIVREEGVGPEERFSSFLAGLEMSGSVTDEARAAYIGIYRLLYQIEKNDGACIGAIVNSGRKLTLANLLTEARTGGSRSNIKETGSEMDARIDDSTPIIQTHYDNSISEQIEYNIRLAQRSAKHTDYEDWSRAAEDSNLEEITLEQLAERLENADEHITASEALTEIRSVMLAEESPLRFLKSFGIKDSVRNGRILERDGEDLYLEFASEEDILGRLDSVRDIGEDELQKRFEQAEEQTRGMLEQELLGDITRPVRSAELQEQLDRCGLMRQLAQQGHYRMGTGGSRPARINLTVIRDAARAGTVSLEISTAAYHIRADLNLEESVTLTEGTMTSSGRIDGRICCESNSELDEVKNELAGFLMKMKGRGYDTDGISIGVDRISPNRYLSRLGEMKKRAAESVNETEGKEQINVPDSKLYEIAKDFVESML